ncbi:MAG: MBL fold metallo-hydrolase [Proteobacteria bacterium]|nr:MBL fold metallo-hydrolase [Pseudomonadota bacterium]
MEKAPELEDWRAEGSPLTVLFGEQRGKYPQGNTLLVEGTREALVIDPSLGMIPRRDRLPAVDRVVNSHCHEDHIAGNFLFPDVPWHFHELDLPGIRSLDAMMAIYDYPEEIATPFRRVVVEQFHFTPCENPVPFRDGDVFDLGDATVRVVHTPGHTRGHSCLHVRWPGDEGGALYLGDIDLSSFGPYYGDAWSDLEDFERSIETVREIEARWYVTFHHIGVVERDLFLERLDRFAAMIASREERLLAYLAEPHDLAEIAEHRFVYRPKDPVPFAWAVERRSMSQHLDRMVQRGAVERLPDGLYRALV